MLQFQPVKDRWITGAFEVTLVPPFGPEVLIHSKKTVRGHGVANTPIEVRVRGCCVGLLDRVMRRSRLLCSD